MAPKHQSVAVQRGASVKSHSYNDDEKVTIITIPVTEEGQGEEEVYNAVMNVEEFLAEHNIRSYTNHHIIRAVQRVKESHSRKRKGGEKKENSGRN